MPGKTVEESFSEYIEKYNRSINTPEVFWAEEANSRLSWFSPFLQVTGGNLTEGDINWFSGGKLNACYNCVDRHLVEKGDQVYRSSWYSHITFHSYFDNNNNTR